MTQKKNRDIGLVEKFGVAYVFFYSGAVDVAAEVDKFYNYYEARDWQVGKGQHIKNKVALAKTWEIKDAAPQLIAVRATYSKFIAMCDPVEVELLTDFVAMIVDEQSKSVTIRCRNGNRLYQVLEDKYIPQMCKFIKQEFGESDYNLEYQFVDM